MEYNFEGLTENQVEQSRAEHGSNAVTPQETESFFDKLADNFKDPMIIILMVALSLVTILAITGFAEWYEGVGIAVAVALATFVSTVSEYKNEQTFQKLQEEASKIIVNVFREGHIKKIGIDDVVVNDRILLQAGDKIPADGKIIAGDMKVNQAMFTGEPLAVLKLAGTPSDDNKNLEDTHLVFRGTTVEDGETVMQVNCVGDKTHFGVLTKEMQTEDRKGPLRVKLGRLAISITNFGYIGALFIALSFIFKAVFLDHNFQSELIVVYFSDWRALYDFVTALILGVIIIVVAVPEGLPMMIAIVLSQNMRKLLTSNVLVRQLLGIETAGSLNILFCDKTGTITKGELTPVSFSSVNKSGMSEFATFDDIPQKLKELLDLSLRKNTSCVLNTCAENHDESIVGGNVTERAMLRFIHADKNKPENSYTCCNVVKEIRFNSIRKFCASQIDLDSKQRITIVRGAPETILQFCTAYYDINANIEKISSELKKTIINEINIKSEQGHRIIAFATSQEALDDSIPKQLTLLGFISLRDTLRDEAKSAIKTLSMAGIQVVMVTGDKIGTAQAIAREVGLIDSAKDIAIDSSELNELSDESLKQLIPHVKVISRCVPQDKKRLVKITQDMGLVVGMTGDGVNDAPALSNSDVGFAMGSGSEVAKEASAIVILDDNINSIANAVHYGRTIYRSIQKFITFQLTVSQSAIIIAFLGPFLGFDMPLTMIQLLWVNLIIDTLAALAFSGEPPLEKHMQEKPKSREESIISTDMWASILMNGFWIAGCCIFFLTASFTRNLFHSEAAFLTAFFCFFVFINNFNEFNVRVKEINIFHHIFQNKSFLKVISLIFTIQIIVTYFGGQMFRTVPLHHIEWAYIMVLASLIIPFDLLRKSIRDLKLS